MKCNRRLPTHSRYFHQGSSETTSQGTHNRVRNEKEPCIQILGL